MKIITEPITTHNTCLRS